MSTLYGHRSHEIAELQRALAGLGLYRGAIDGGFGAGTLAAVRDAQLAYGLNETGIVDLPLLIELGLAAPKPKRAKPFSDFLTGLALRAALAQLKGNPMVAFLDGYKTYIVGFAGLIVGALALIGWGIPGLPPFSPGDALELINISLIGLGLRRALKTGP
ncbi:MAG: peptidoglycan-binding domain-containing protein [Devosia sp.]